MQQNQLDHHKHYSTCTNEIQISWDGSEWQEAVSNNCTLVQHNLLWLLHYKTCTQVSGSPWRISDYLLSGEGTWWKYSTDGVEFLDGQVEYNVSEKGPKWMHFRTTTMWDIEIYLQQKWEDCIFIWGKPSRDNIQHYIPYESSPGMEIIIETTHSSVQIGDLPGRKAPIPTLECTTTPIAATVSTTT